MIRQLIPALLNTLISLSKFLMGEVQPKYWFGEGCMMQFEDMAVRGMALPKKFLVKFYGPNFMTPPPENERSKHNVEIVEIQGGTGS